MDRDWTMTEKERPPEDLVVQTMNSGGQVQDMLFWKNLWWDPEKKMYAYYTPKCWKLLE